MIEDKQLAQAAIEIYHKIYNKPKCGFYDSTERYIIRKIFLNLLTTLENNREKL